MCRFPRPPIPVSQRCRMFRWLLGSTRSARPASRRTRPRLEALEGRDCPSANVADFHVVNTTGCEVKVTGTVAGNEDLKGVTVVLSGVVKGEVHPDGNGHFEYGTTAG